MLGQHDGILLGPLVLGAGTATPETDITTTLLRKEGSSLKKPGLETRPDRQQGLGGVNRTAAFRLRCVGRL